MECIEREGTPRSTVLMPTSREFAEKESSLRIGGVPLVAVRLDHSAFIEKGPVVVVMLPRIVWMDGVSHVGGHQEGVPDGDLEHLVGGVEAAEHPADGLRHNGAACSHC